jgi:DNA-binding CsgD family transcriptional regulator
MRLSFGTKELEMIQMICDGRTSEEMADLLHLSKKAIDARRADLLKRLEAKNPVDFVRKCMLLALYKPRTDEEILKSDEAREMERKMRRIKGSNT